MDPLAALSPTTWFALAQDALRRGDRAEAARCLRRLRALGVRVKFERRPRLQLLEQPARRSRRRS